MLSKRPSSTQNMAQRPLQCQLEEIQKILKAIENDNRFVNTKIFNKTVFSYFKERSRNTSSLPNFFFLNVFFVLKI